MGIGPVQLETTGRFIGSEISKLEGLIPPVYQWTRIDHFTDVEPRTEFSANRPEGVIRDPCHWRQNDGRPDGNLANLYRREFPGRCRIHVSIDSAAIYTIH